MEVQFYVLITLIQRLFGIENKPMQLLCIFKFDLEQENNTVSC